MSEQPDLGEQLAAMMTIADAAALFGVAVSTINMWRTRDILPVPDVVVAGKPLWWPQNLEAWGRRTGRLEGVVGHIYDHMGYDVTTEYWKRASDDV